MDLIQYDEEFHAGTYAAANRPRTLALVTTLRRRLNAYYLRYLGPHTRAKAWRAEHRALVRALRRRDTVKAKAALRRHLLRTREVLLKAITSEESLQAKQGAQL